MDSNEGFPPATTFSLQDPETSPQRTSDPDPGSFPTARHPFCPRSLRQARGRGKSLAKPSTCELEHGVQEQEILRYAAARRGAGEVCTLSRAARPKSGCNNVQ